MDRLAKAKVAIFGIGGVGGYVAEALARSGVGSFVLVDDDKVCLTNINRQIIATRKTIGQYKAEVMRDRILEINPDAQVEVRKCFYLPENADEFDFTEYSYVVDAVDTVTAKLEIIMRAISCEIPVISLKTLLFLMYYFDGNCEDKVTVPLSDLCFMFGHDSNALCSNNRAHHADALFPIWNGLLINHSHSAVITIWSV